MLPYSLMPVSPLITSGDWTFQQQNTFVHISCSTKSWLNLKVVKPLQRPSRCPNLNPLENFYGILATVVYKNGYGDSTAARIERKSHHRVIVVRVDPGKLNTSSFSS
ncbi:hypothetical protein CEXT_5421 [Caerostris extrusa]|uniref:LAGLIDADG homing endonuclease n=1 Tax=Caerostris extrusa TaxID=172846 RepID=A0AAV4S4Y6_CAEEX|nr:hypothetical protein CEXT_5421 [Caerostris extrusa]